MSLTEGNQTSFILTYDLNDALEVASSESKRSREQYAIDAIEGQLEQDGYLS